MNALKLLLLLVLLVGLGGAWNYRRNEPLDEELAFRPYAGVSDEDLQALLDAHQERVLHMAQDFTGGGPDTSMRHLAPSDFRGKIKQFERFQQDHERWRQGRREMLSEQTMVDAVEHERSIRRRGLHQPWGRIMRRVTTR